MPRKKPQNSVSDLVMQRIKNNDITMKPRTYFTVISFIVVIVSILAGLILAYVMSIANFWLRILTADTMAYGARRNLQNAIASFPWWLVVVAIVFSCIALWLLRKNSRLYRFHVATLASAFVLLAFVFSLFFVWLGIGNPNNVHQNHLQRYNNSSRQ